MIHPSQRVQYLGIDIDTVLMEYLLPPDKLARLEPLLSSFQGRELATKLQLQSLAGLLSHCSYVLKGGRVFTCRIIDLINTLPHDKSVGWLDELVKSDLSWWQSFARMFNDKAGIIGSILDPEVHIYTDSSFTSFGRTCGNDFFLGTWKSPPPVLSPWVSSGHWCFPPVFTSIDWNINVLEMWPVMCAVLRWGHTWRNRRIIVYTDNNQVMFSINLNMSKNLTVREWLKEVFWTSYVYNFHLSAKRISSSDNILADCLSRFTSNSARCLGQQLLHRGHFLLQNGLGW